MIVTTVLYVAAAYVVAYFGAHLIVALLDALGLVYRAPAPPARPEHYIAPRIPWYRP